MSSMPSEGSGRSTVLENHFEQHIGVPGAESETSQNGTSQSVNETIKDTATELFLKLFALLVCCFVIVVLIFSLVGSGLFVLDHFIGECPVNGTYPYSP